jgi:hypothetical protein
MQNPNEDTRSRRTIVDWYMPNATEAEREEVRESIRRLAALFARVCERIAREEVDNAIRQNAMHKLDSDSSFPS